MDNEEKLPTPGLKYRSRKDGPVPYWFPRADAVKAGYPSTAFALKDYAHDPKLLSEKCCALQGRMLSWMSGPKARKNPGFDGTIGSVFKLYETHEDSPIHKLKPGTVAPYLIYLRLMTDHIGKVRVTNASALDVKRWHKEWSGNNTKPAAGKMCVAILKAALSFAVAAKHRECRDLLNDMRELRFPSVKPRSVYFTTGQVIEARRAAHAHGWPSAALCFALQFETTLRLWDVTGQWFPLDYPVMSSITKGDKKWVGLEWRHIGPDMILRYRPSKTQFTSEKEVAIDLRLCPMVLEEIEQIPADRRHGPMIVQERTRMPYTRLTIAHIWPRIRETARLPETLWVRDLRASGITEARSAGAVLDDTSKVAGHAQARITSDVYDRASLEAHRRVAAVRIAARESGRSFEGGTE